MKRFDYQLRLAAMAALLMFILASAAYAAKIVTVESGQCKIRRGAGNYFEVIYVASEGAKLEVIEEKNGWYKVKLPNGKTGYASVKSISGKKDGGPKTKKWIEDEGVGKVASSEIMAATKGVVDMGKFAKAYAKKHNVDSKTIDEIGETPFTAEEYEKFVSTLPRGPKVSMEGMTKDAITDYEREIGTAVALRLASMGLSADKGLRKYVSLVGTAATQNTPLEDETFYFIVLDSPKVQSFATPAGFVFITTGALRIMKTEADLAGVLSHEIMHVVQHHGVKELEKQKERISGQKALDELEGELSKLNLDQGDKKVEEDLMEMADGMFEQLISGRKKDTEDEADRLGAMLSYNTGYKADGLKQFILATGKIEAGQKDPSYSHSPAEARAAALDKVIGSHRLTAREKKDFKDRFVEKAGK